MKNSIKLLSILLITIILLTGCKKEDNIYFFAETGDQIEIIIDDSSYKISKDVPFNISKDNNNIITGDFISKEGYDYYLTTTSKDTKATDRISKDEEGEKYLYYTYDDKEFVYIINVPGTETYIRLIDDNSKEELDEVFKLFKAYKK